MLPMLLSPTRIGSLALILFGTTLLTGCQFSLFENLSLESNKRLNPYLVEALTENEEHFHAWFLLGKEHIKLNQPEAAIDAFKKSKELRPGYEEARLGLGYAYLQIERWKEAEEEFVALLELNSNSPEGLEGLAVAYLERNKKAESRQAAERALSLDQDLPRAHAVLGRLSYAEMDFVKAEEHWKKALEVGFPPQNLEPIYQDLRRMMMKYGTESGE